MHKNVGGFKFGNLVAHRQTAKLNVSPIFLCLQYIYLQLLLSGEIPLKGSVFHSLNWISFLLLPLNLTCIPIAGRKKVTHQSADQNEFGNANDQLF